MGWNGPNGNSVRTRAVSAALYPRANKILLAICCYNIVLIYAVKAFYIWRNTVRDRKWAAMTREEQEDYQLNTTDEGMKRLDFRLSH